MLLPSQWFVHSSFQQIFIEKILPDTVLSAENTSMNKTDKIPAFKFLYETNEESEVQHEDITWWLAYF